jgi:hypothetical protein
MQLGAQPSTTARVIRLDERRPNGAPARS